MLARRRLESDLSSGPEHERAQRPPAEPAAALLALQRSAGNAAVARLLARAPAAAATPRTHVVAPGETLASLAKAFGVTVDALVAANAGKLKRWKTPKGERTGFNAGETIVIPDAAPAAAPAPDAATQAPAAPPPATGTGVLDAAGDLVEWAQSVWDSWFGGTGSAPPVVTPAPVAPAPGGDGAPAGAAPAPAATSPVDVIATHNAAGTFGQPVTVNSTKRDGNKQLSILQGYCSKWKAEIDAYAEATDWLKGSLDWDAFGKATLADEAVWLPFFFALYYGGGGPGVKSDERTLPLVASPAQRTWTDKTGKSRTANASPHIRGNAMDVDAEDLKALEKSLNNDIPEFAKTGAFPIHSLQPETTSGHTAIHINFENIVFP